MSQTGWLALRPFRRHSLVLLVAGVVYVLIGISYMATSVSASRQTALQLPLAFAPMAFWGCVFIVVGVLAVLSARWPPASETWGYTALTMLSVGWAMAYLSGILVLGAPWSGFSGFASWALIGFLWWAISGLRNPQDLPVDDSNE